MTDPLIVGLRRKLEEAEGLLGRWMFWASGVAFKSEAGESVIRDTDTFLGPGGKGAACSTCGDGQLVFEHEVAGPVPCPDCGRKPPAPVSPLKAIADAIRDGTFVGVSPAPPADEGEQQPCHTCGGTFTFETMTDHGTLCDPRLRPAPPEDKP